jgi:hypothetical protein
MPNLRTMQARHPIFSSFSSDASGTYFVWSTITAGPFQSVLRPVSHNTDPQRQAADLGLLATRLAIDRIILSALTQSGASFPTPWRTTPPSY